MTAPALPVRRTVLPPPWVTQPTVGIQPHERAHSQHLGRQQVRSGMGFCTCRQPCHAHCQLAGILARRGEIMGAKISTGARLAHSVSHSGHLVGRRGTSAARVLLASSNASPYSVPRSFKVSRVDACAHPSSVDHGSRAAPPASSVCTHAPPTACAHPACPGDRPPTDSSTARLLLSAERAF